MLSWRHRFIWLSIVGLASLTLATSGMMRAAEEDEAAEAPGRLTGPKLTGRFAPPEGDVAAQLKFMRAMEAEMADAMKLRILGPAAVKAAATKILETEKDKNSEAYKAAFAAMLPIRVNEIGRATPEARQEVINDILADLKSKAPLKPGDSRLASNLGAMLDRTGNQKLAAETYQTFSEVLAKSNDLRVQSEGAKMEGAARRMGLLGHEMALEGTPVNHGQSTFDWSKYRGKVVLVDFWATWCGPCLGELPNVKRNYRKYHDRGFDVVGISIDADREKLDEFLEGDELPWVVLNEAKGGWESAICKQYGINSIPCVILVNKEGKVISLNARGKELGKLLEQELGPAKATASNN